MAPGIPDEPIQATPQVLFEHFRKLYWSTLQDEARNMIKFHRELMGSRHDLSHKDRLDSSYLDSFRKIFNLWCKTAASFLLHRIPEPFNFAVFYWRG